MFESLPEGLPRLISVGRLDLNSEGLLLLTNDGALARALEMPASAVVRHYRARAYGRITQDRLDKLKDGITVEGVRYGPIEARLDKAKEGPQGSNLWLTVSLHEGKNREVRRVLEALGLKVNRLIRLAYGPFVLGPLGVGEIEEVGPRVVREQLAEHIEPDNLPAGERPQYRSRSKTSRRPSEPLAAPVTAPERPAKIDYKPGWAKPKSKPRALAIAKPPAKPGVKARTKPDPKPFVRSPPRSAGPAAKAAAGSGGKPRPRPSGSPRVGGPGPGPRGPKRSASPPGSSAVRPANRPKPGGRGPRG